MLLFQTTQQQMTPQMQQPPQITMTTSLPQPNIQLQQQIPQTANPQNAPTTPAIIDTAFDNLIKYYKEKPPLVQIKSIQTNGEKLELLMTQTDYQRNKTQKKFINQINLKRSQNLLQEALNIRVLLQFQRYDLSHKNIEYQKDELSRLKQLMHTNKKKENTLFQSVLVVKEFNSMKTQDYLDLNNKYQESRNTHNAYCRIEEITKERQQNGVSELLKDESKKAGIYLPLEKKPQDKGDEIIEELFYQNGLSGKLFNFFPKSKMADQKQNLDLFKCFFDQKSDHNDIIDILNKQFSEIDLPSQDIKLNLIKSSVKILEDEQSQQIGQADIANYNQKFIDYYYDELSGLRIKKLGQYYPSGILFLLLRCGKMEFANKILSSFQTDQKYSRFISLLKADNDNNQTNQKKIQEFEQNFDDELFLQCCYLTFDSGQVLEIFETTHFKNDKDLFLWMTLKTTHSHETKDNNSNWLIKDLQETIPKNVNYKINILLLRYNLILEKIQKGCIKFLSKMEYLILFTIIKNLLQYQGTNEESSFIDRILELLFQNYPQLGIQIIRIQENNEETAIKNIQEQMKKFDYSPEILTNQRFSKTVEKIFDEQKRFLIVKGYVYHLFEKKLIQCHSDFIERGIRSNDQNALKQNYDKFVTSINQISEELQNYCGCFQKEKNNMISQVIYIIGIVLAIGEYLFLKNIRNSPKSTVNPIQYHNIFTEIQQQLNDESQQQLFQFLSVFHCLIQFAKTYKFDVDKFNLQCQPLDLQKLSSILITRKQYSLLKLFFSLVEQQKKFTSEKIQILQRRKDHQSNAPLSQVENGTIKLLTVELKLQFLDV